MYSVHLVSAATLLAALAQAAWANGPVALSLDEALRVAQERSAGVLQAEQEVEAAQAQKKAAATHWFPSVSAQATALRSQNYLVKMGNAGGNLPVYDGNLANLPSATQYAYMPPSQVGLVDRMGVGMVSVSQPLYMGGRILAGNQLAEIGMDVQRLKRDMARNDAVVQTADRYWTLQSLQATRQTLEAQTLLLDTLAREVALAFRGGLATSRDTLDLFLRREEAATQLAMLNDGIALAESDLCRSLDNYCSGPLDLRDTLQVTDNPDMLRADHDALLGGRSESRLLEKSVQAQERQSALDNGELLPQVLVGAALIEMTDFKNSPTHNAMVFANVSVPISGLWEGHYRRQSNHAKEEQIRFRAEENRRLLRLEMDKAWNDLTASWRSLALARTAMQREELAMADCRTGFRAGMQKASELVETQLKRQAAQGKEIEARKQYLHCRLTYLRVTGRLTQ